jgi:hypothetical protein
MYRAASSSSADFQRLRSPISPASRSTWRASRLASAASSAVSGASEPRCDRPGVHIEYQPPAASSASSASKTIVERRIIRRRS